MSLKALVKEEIERVVSTMGETHITVEVHREYSLILESLTMTYIRLSGLK